MLAFGDLIGPGFQADADVVEITDDEGFQLDRLAGFDGQPAMFELGVDLKLLVFFLGEDHAAAALGCEKSGDDSLAAFRIGRGQPHIAADSLARLGKAAGAQDLQLVGGATESNFSPEDWDFVDDQRLVLQILNPCLNDCKRKIIQRSNSERESVCPIGCIVREAIRRAGQYDFAFDEDCI